MPKDPNNPWKIASDRPDRDKPDRVPEWALNLIADSVVFVIGGVLGGLGLMFYAGGGFGVRFRSTLLVFAIGFIGGGVAAVTGKSFLFSDGRD